MSHIAAEREYWEKQLAGRDFVCAAFPDLPPATPVASAERGGFDFDLGKYTASRLLALANGSDHALFTLLLAGLRQLLCRYTGHTKLALGAPVFATGFDPLRRNTVLVLAGEVRRDQSFKEVLRQERETVLGAKQHQDFPIAHALAALNVPCSPESFGVCLSLRNVQHPGYAQAERPAMAFAFERHSGGIHGTLAYSPARYDAGYVAQIAAHLDTLLLAGGSNPSAALADHELLSPTERARLLTEFSRRAAPATALATIVTEFEAQAALAPDRIALSCDAETLSYAELNRRANRLAHGLRASGVGPEEPVALYLPRSIEAIVGMLGILKAGGAYLPLDPACPPARNRFMIDDAGVRTILTRGDPPQRVELGPANWLRLDAERDQLERHAASNPPAGPSPENIAYILYTSGTTGKPKGVPIPHRGVIQLVKSTEFIRITPDEVFLLQSALTFDASALEIWGALLNGARLVIAAQPQPSIDELAGVIRAEKVNCLLQTAALFHLMVEERPSALLPIRQLMVGGDVMSVRHARDFLQTFPGRLCNLYGPTENSVVSTVQVVSGADLRGGRVPIGRPIGTTEVYMLDDTLRPVPVGVTGEIYLGGGGLARGYLHRRALTGERFVPHPFSATPGARLYRSGDLGRFLPDGTIEFGGRADGQVKIRGFRIELSEVESLLCEHPAVKAAAVVVETDAHGTKRLVAFAVARDGHAPAGRDLQEFLLQRTPGHQIPAAYIFRDELPLNQSGKIDRSRLLGLIATEASVAGEPPRTPAEHAMAAIWKQVLGRENISVGDDFFALGGDSLLAMQVLARINKSGFRLPAKLFFREPTIAACALAARPVAAVNPDDDTGPQGSVSLTPVQRWFFDTHAADPNHFNLSALFDVKDAIDPAIVARAAGHLIRHHDAFLLVFDRDSTGWTARYAPPPNEEAWSTIVDLSAGPEEGQLRELEARAQVFQSSLDITAGPLIRFVYFQRGGGGRDRLLVVAHHLVIDVVSWRILLDDLETALGQLHAGRDVQLPRKTDLFGTWANQLPAYLQSAAATAGRAYWLQMPPSLASASSPAIAADSSTSTSELFCHTFTVEETQSLRRVVREAQATIEELLLAALLLQHAADSNTSQLTVTLDRHGRAESVGTLDVSRTIGWFTAFVPVYLTLGNERSFEGALAVVRETLRRIPNRGVDFGLLRYLGQPEERRRLAAFPPPGISLNYQGEFDQELGGSSYFKLSSDAFGSQQSARHRRFHGLDIDAAIIEGKLGVLAASDPGRNSREQAARLIAGIAAILRSLPHCFHTGYADISVKTHGSGCSVAPGLPQPVA